MKTIGAIIGLKKKKKEKLIKEIHSLMITIGAIIGLKKKKKETYLLALHE
jgi:hypothetical protein